MDIINNNFIVTPISVYPGMVLQEWLEELNITQKEFASQIGVPCSRLNEIIKGKKPLNEDFAQLLVDPLGMSADYWMRLQAQYEYNERMLKYRNEEEEKSNTKEEAIKEKFSLSILYERLEIKSVSSVRRVAELFEKLNTNFEKLMTDNVCMSYFKHSDKLKVDDKNLRTWVLISEYQSRQNKPSAKYQKGNALFAAKEIAQATNECNISESAIKQILNKFGIAYSVVQRGKLKHCPVDAYSFMNNETPSIVTSHRFDKMDRLVFDVLHELGHIHLHMSEENKEFLNVEEYPKDNTMEHEANEFASDTLIPKSDWKKITSITASPFQMFDAIGKRASEMGYNPYIAVSRYMYETANYKSKSYSKNPIA